MSVMASQIMETRPFVQQNHAHNEIFHKALHFWPNVNYDLAYRLQNLSHEYVITDRAEI